MESLCGQKQVCAVCHGLCLGLLPGEHCQDDELTMVLLHLVHCYCISILPRQNAKPLHCVMQMQRLSRNFRGRRRYCKTCVCLYGPVCRDVRSVAQVNAYWVHEYVHSTFLFSIKNVITKKTVNSFLKIQCINLISKRNGKAFEHLTV
jgi:hypothetical protein